MMAKEQCKWMLDTFHSDSSGMLDVASVRIEELKDSPIYDLQWFIKSRRLTTFGRRVENRYYGVYRNSFSEWRTAYREFGKIKLD